MMRLRLLPSSLLLAIATSAFDLPNFVDFIPALPITLADYIPPTVSNETHHENLKRQVTATDGCPNHFQNCANMGAPGLCCATKAVCSPDAAGHVACCPSGEACSGTVAGVITGGTVNSDGSAVTGTTGSTVAGGGAVGGAATTTDSFVGPAQTGNSNSVYIQGTSLGVAGRGVQVVSSIRVFWGKGRY